MNFRELTTPCLCATHIYINFIYVLFCFLPNEISPTRCPSRTCSRKKKNNPGGVHYSRQLASSSSRDDQELDAVGGGKRWFVAHLLLEMLQPGSDTKMDNLVGEKKKRERVRIDNVLLKSANGREGFSVKRQRFTDRRRWRHTWGATMRETWWKINKYAVYIYLFTNIWFSRRSEPIHRFVFTKN